MREGVHRQEQREDQREQPEGEGHRRAGERGRQFDARARGLAGQLGVPAAQVQRDPAYAHPEVPGDEGVPQLVQQDRGGEPGDQPGADQVPERSGQPDLQVRAVGEDQTDGEDQPRPGEEDRYPGDPAERVTRAGPALLLHRPDATYCAHGAAFPSYPCPNLSAMTVDVDVVEQATGQRAHRPSLSPSRAADFKTCPLLYRFRSIDRLPEQPSPDQARGTLVHAVLERLFDLPPTERTREQAAALIEPQWERLLEEQEELAGLFADGSTPDEFLAATRGLLDGYFAVEDPRRLEPAERECLVTTEVDEGRLVLRGYVDRLDVSPAGDLRVVDYKTGGAPREAFEARALFQLKFYALVLWRTRGVVPRVLRLLYLKDAEVCDYTPDVEELV